MKTTAITTTLRLRLLAFCVLVVTLALATPSRAQEPAPSPSTSPTASPSLTVVKSPESETGAELDAIEIEAEVERAQARAQREIELAKRSLERSRGTIERGALRAARSMALADGAWTRASMEARLATETAMREASAARESAFRDAWQDSSPSPKERELEARERAREKELEARERAREKELEARERARARSQEARERALEQKEAAADRLEELYEEAMDSIDEEEWSAALRPLSKLMSLNAKVDAALYWTSYAQCKMSQTAASLANLARLQKEFPTSRWAKEGKALEMEVRGKSGQTPRPDQQDDLDLKLMAVSALAQSDPQEAMPMLTKILGSPTSSRKIRERSLFVLAQIGSEEASKAIAEVARGDSSPELQRKAIQYLGVFGGSTNRKVLSDVYGSTTDNALRKQILNSFMVSGDKARVLSAARTEKDPALRSVAVRLLGVMGGTAELSQMYSTAASTDEKKAILQALFIGGAVEPVASAARGEKDKEVRLAAVRNLGLMGRKSEVVLTELYSAEQDPDVKKEVLNAYFLQGNSTRLVSIARAEKDPELKKEAVHWLSLMNSKESRAYMMELLKD